MVFRLSRNKRAQEGHSLHYPQEGSRKAIQEPARGITRGRTRKAIQGPQRLSGLSKAGGVPGIAAHHPGLAPQSIYGTPGNYHSASYISPARPPGSPDNATRRETTHYPVAWHYCPCSLRSLVERFAPPVLNGLALSQGSFSRQAIQECGATTVSPARFLLASCSLRSLAGVPPVTPLQAGGCTIPSVAGLVYCPVLSIPPPVR